MHNADKRKEWEAYKNAELTRVIPLIHEHGFTLDTAQPHIGGERYLMQAVTTTSGRKLILLGKRVSDGMRVVIKATSDPKGILELKHEQRCRNLLHSLRFALECFYSPEEVATIHGNGMYIVVRTFIEQEMSFLDRPLEEQFLFVLRSFKAQERTRASAYAQLRQIRKVFDWYDAKTYLKLFSDFKTNIAAHGQPSDYTLDVLNRAEQELSTHTDTLDRYAGFLTHTDFVPHNIRIAHDIVYLLDLSSIRFGNKYEGWARFANFMALYEPKLLEVLLQYVRDNRTPEEYTSLRLMRMFRLGEIIWYYVQASEHSDEDLQKLNRARVEFWTAVLSAVLNDTPLSEEVRRQYIATRDSLRSEDEKKRQVGLH